MLLKRRYLVFRWTHRAKGVACRLSEIQWNQVEKHSIAAGIPAKKAKLLARDVAQGAVGLIAQSAEQWAFYGRIKPCVQGVPRHLGRIRCDGSWIFGCRTNQSFRNQGLFQEGIQRLARVAEITSPDAAIYIDSEPHNVAAHRAILRAGFEPAGVVSTRMLRLPRMSLVVSSCWHHESAHSGEEHQE